MVRWCTLNYLICTTAEQMLHMAILRITVRYQNMLCQHTDNNKEIVNQLEQCISRWASGRCVMKLDC